MGSFFWLTPYENDFLPVDPENESFQSSNERCELSQDLPDHSLSVSFSRYFVIYWRIKNYNIPYYIGLEHAFIKIEKGLRYV